MVPDPDASLVFDPPDPTQWFGAGLAQVAGVPVFPSGIGADRSTSLRGLASDPTVAATGGRVPAMAVVSLSVTKLFILSP